MKELELGCWASESGVEHHGLVWKRDNKVPDLPEKLTKRIVFPVCGWLCVASSYVKRLANAATTSWDDEIADFTLHSMLEEILERVKRSDPA